MDDRRQALREILDLLKSEGWSKSPNGVQRMESQSERPIFKRHSAVNFLILVAVTVNVVALTSLHDSRTRISKEREAVLSLLSLKCPEAPTTLRALEISIGVDDKVVWYGHVDADRLIDLRHVNSEKFDTKCVIKVWIRKPYMSQWRLVGARVISFDQSKGQIKSAEFTNYFDEWGCKVSFTMDYKVGG